MPILTNTDYPTIRSIMGVDITQVPDSVFADFAHEPAAEDWAINLVPDYATLTGADASNLKRAIAYYTAYLTADWLRLRLYDRLKLGDAEYQRNRQLDWGAAAIQWLAMAEDFITRISTRLLGVSGTSLIAIGGPTSDGTSLIPNVNDTWWSR